jgi:hypothetical protein
VEYLPGSTQEILDSVAALEKLFRRFHVGILILAFLAKLGDMEPLHLNFNRAPWDGTDGKLCTHSSVYHTLYHSQMSYIK